MYLTSGYVCVYVVELKAQMFLYSDLCHIIFNFKKSALPFKYLDSIETPISSPS